MPDLVEEIQELLYPQDDTWSPTELREFLNRPDGDFPEGSTPKASDIIRHSALSVAGLQEAVGPVCRRGEP